MKKFLSKISLFLLVLLACLIGLSQIHISDEFVIEKTHETSYEKLAWDLKKLQHPETLNDANIFIGPSLVQGDVNDSMLTASGIYSVNMAINHNGFDLDHYVAKRIMEVSKTEKMFLYRPRDGGSMLHPMMPLLVSPIDYACTYHQFPVTFIRKYFPKRVYFAMQYLWSKVFPGNAIYQPSAYGWRGEVNTVIGSMKDNEAAIEEEIARREDFGKTRINKDGTFYTPSTIKSYWRKTLYYYRGAAEPIRRITVESAQKYNIPVSEIYMPVYDDAIIDSRTDNKTFFRQISGYDYDCFTLSSYSFLNDSNLWFDHHHLNSNGAVMFTDSLIVHFPQK
ncbi:MAG: hypothetical protein KDC07_00490 [Chitinophagaceae bacterium]|nr:hypothetical protein [Chitinophagaceae bacterium]